MIGHRFPARAAMDRAKEEAVRSGSALVGSEHLLMAVVSEASGRLRAILWDAGVSRDRLAASLHALEKTALRSIGIDVETEPRPVFLPRRIPWSSGAKNAFHEAIRLAGPKGREVTLDHLLSALCDRSSNDQATILLRHARVDRTRVLAALRPPQERSA